MMNDICELLGEGLTATQCEVYSKYAHDLRRVESADYIFAEQIQNQESLDRIFKLLREGAEGADVMGELTADYRRKRDLCALEIKRRDRAGAFPPSGAIVLDFSDAKRAIKERTLEIIESYGITLQVRGKESFGLCPFHEDHHPSFRVNPIKQLWYCDPCGFGGDVFDFIARMERLNHVN